MKQKNQFSKLAADRKFPAFCAWLWYCVHLANWLWQNSAFAWRFEHWSQNSLGGWKSWRWLPHWYRQSHLHFLTAGDKIGTMKFWRARAKIISRSRLVLLFWLIMILVSSLFLYSDFLFLMIQLFWWHWLFVIIWNKIKLFPKGFETVRLGSFYCSDSCHFKSQLQFSLSSEVGKSLTQNTG